MYFLYVSVVILETPVNLSVGAYISLHYHIIKEPIYVYSRGCSSVLSHLGDESHRPRSDGFVARVALHLFYPCWEGFVPTSTAISQRGKGALNLRGNFSK